MPIKILATADLHLGKRSSAVTKSSEESATKYTWAKLVDYAVENDVDAVTLSGDIVDRDNRYFEAIGPLQEGFQKLEDVAIPVVVVAGNHDYDVLSDVVKDDDFDNVHFLGKRGDWVDIVLQLGGISVQFLGWSFPKQHISQDPSLAIDANQLKTEMPSIGLLHGDVYDKDSSYAPIGLTNLAIPNINAWVLGHIHKPDILNDAPLILYPGSPHALSPKESGQHGPYILSVDSLGAVSAEQLALSPIRYETFSIDVSGIINESEFRDRIITELTDYVHNNPEDYEYVSSIVFDINLTGRHPRVTEIDNWMQFAGEYEQVLLDDTEISIRKVNNLAEPEVENLDQLAGQSNPPGILAQMILDLEGEVESDFVEDYMNVFEEGLSNINKRDTYLPIKLQEGQELMDVNESKELVLRECRHLLAELLSQTEES